jgi:glucose/arabinose dehydrogenase
MGPVSCSINYMTTHSRASRLGCLALVAATVVLAAACTSSSAQSVRDEIAGFGPSPLLPEPDQSLIPTINVVKAVGWSAGATPVAARGTAVAAFARDLEHPRWLYVLPNGDVLVAETNAPDRPEDNTGLRGWFFKRYQKKAGGAVPSANRITLLRDADGDGVAETKSPLVSGLTSPFGMALVGGFLYIANADAIVRVPYATGALRIPELPMKVVDLPGGLRNHHWTKNILANADGSKLYVAIGSNSNVAEHGMDEEKGRAEIWEYDIYTGTTRTFASGLRNPVGMTWEPTTGALWVAVNERDELGDDLVPDYMTSVKDGGFYGWPYSYYGANVDDRVKPARPDLVAKAIRPDYALGSHTASLGLAYGRTDTLSNRFGTGMFVGQHGSWNRKPRAGYRVLFVPFSDGKPAGLPVDVLTGFVTQDGDAFGRPVGVAVDNQGALLVADDVGNTVWRVTAARQ